MKMRYRFVLLSIALVAVLFFPSPGNILHPALAQSGNTTTYTGDYATAFPNPERGFHNRYEIINDPNVNPYASSATAGIAGFNPDLLDRTFSRAKADGDTIIHSYLHLDDFVNTHKLPQQLLDNLTSGLAAIRAAGLKIILRPAYVWNTTPYVPESRILGHIAQLNAVISANADVVLHLEAGYLGEWGEWHDDQYTDPFNRTEADTRYRVIQKIASTTPDSLPILIRYPLYIREVTTPSVMPAPAGTPPLTQTQMDRIGFHDDCFLSDSADMGTYDPNSWMGWFTIDQKRQWMYSLATSSGANKMVGGETCDSAGYDDSAGVNVQYYMGLLHYTEINEDYAPVNTNIWKAANLAASGNDPAETAFVRIKRKMGYRIRLVDATFPGSATAGGNFSFAADLSNDGYGSFIHGRPVYLVFQNGSSRFNIPLSDIDVRLWLTGANSIPTHNLTLPTNMPNGTYTLALWLPDPSSGLQSRPEYSVRFANLNTWDSTNGYNILSTGITISGGCTTNCPPTLTPTNTPNATSTPRPTATSVLATPTPGGTTTKIDSFVQATWNNKLNDLNQSVSWSMDSVYYGSTNPNYIVTDSGVSGQYYEEDINRNLTGVSTLDLRLSDWNSGTGSEQHWNVDLNDGADHTLSLSTYGTMTGTFQDFNIPLSAFGANLANVKYLRIIHKDGTYAVILYNAINLLGAGGTAVPTNTPLPATSTPQPTVQPPTNTSVPPTRTPQPTVQPPTNTPVVTNTPVPPTNTPTKTNTPVPPTNTPRSEERR